MEERELFFHFVPSSIVHKVIPMLTIEYRGAFELLELFRQIQQGKHPTQDQISAVLDQNAFYVAYYCQWKGITREKIAEVLVSFSQPEWQPEHPVQAGMARGWRFALKNLDMLHANLEKFKAIDASAVIEHTARFLPDDTPLDSFACFTVDGFNGGFQYRGGMGLSILMFDRVETVLTTISHELHHVGFNYWSSRDPVRKTVMSEQSGRQVAMLHVQNLLLEGMANYYCSPMRINRETMSPALVGRIEQLQREEATLLAQAADIFARAMAADADFAACQKDCEALMVDYQGILPAGHMIGQRMVEIMSQVHERAAIVDCVKSLPSFLPLYNQAARQAGAQVFDPAAVERFSQIWQ